MRLVPMFLIKKPKIEKKEQEEKRLTEAEGRLKSLEIRVQLIERNLNLDAH